MGISKENKIWDAACKKVLHDISVTFGQNAHKADNQSDRDVFIAISQTIKNFPIPQFDETKI